MAMLVGGLIVSSALAVRALIEAHRICNNEELNDWERAAGVTLNVGAAVLSVADIGCTLTSRGNLAIQGCTNTPRTAPGVGVPARQFTLPNRLDMPISPNASFSGLANSRVTVNGNQNVLTMSNRLNAPPPALAEGTMLGLAVKEGAYACHLGSIIFEFGSAVKWEIGNVPFEAGLELFMVTCISVSVGGYIAADTLAVLECAKSIQNASDLVALLGTVSGAGVVYNNRKIYLEFGEAIMKFLKEKLLCLEEEEKKNPDRKEEIRQQRAEITAKISNSSPEELAREQIETYKMIESLKSISELEEIPRCLYNHAYIARMPYKCSLTGKPIRYVLLYRTERSSTIYYEKKEIEKWFAEHPRERPSGWPDSARSCSLQELIRFNADHPERERVQKEINTNLGDAIHESKKRPVNINKRAEQNRINTNNLIKV